MFELLFDCQWMSVQPVLYFIVSFFSIYVKHPIGVANTISVKSQPTRL